MGRSKRHKKKTGGTRISHVMSTRLRRVGITIQENTKARRKGITKTIQFFISKQFASRSDLNDVPLPALPARVREAR